MSWNFKLCGQDEGPLVEARTPTLNDTYPATLRVGFSIPEDENIHFHFESEDCKKLRPFKDLYERWTLGKVDGRTIFLHSKAPLRLTSRPVAKDDSGAEQHVDRTVGNESHVAFEADELSQAETEAEKKDEEQYDTSEYRAQSPLGIQAEDNGDEGLSVSDGNEQPEVQPQADKDSDEQHDTSDNTQQSQVETQAEAKSDEQHSVSDDKEQSQVEAEADENSDAGNEAQGDLAATTAQPQDVTGLKYIALIHGGMHPHGTSTVDKTDHQCKIRFRVEQPGDSRRDWANVDFRPQEFMTSESTLLRDLPGMIKTRLAEDLHERAHEKKDLAKRYRRIFFRLSVVVQAYGHDEIDLHDPKYGLRFRTIQDLLLVPEVKGSQLEVIVRAGSKSVEQPTDSSERRASRTQLEQIAAANMIQAIPLDDKVNSSVFRRVGNHETVDSSSDGHPYARPLIAEIDNDKIELRKGDASIFGDELVGDVRNGDNAPTGMAALKDYKLAPQYIVKAPKILNKTNLFALIREAGLPTDDLEKLPILPPLSFNLFRTGASDPTGDESPHSQVPGHSQRSSDSMTAVVRFVNHLTSDEGRELVFYNNTEIEFDEPDTYAIAEKAVITSIEEQREEYNGWDAFKPDSTIPSYLELFVRPQLPAPQKLFRIPTTGEGSDAKMMGFLSPQEVNKGMRTVYMEAHIWPKQ
ncbi:hypothetical protein KC331_g1029 [Hortaea werneckii]|uniref:Uncharacterized protein n=1 Tax=Hortaea werneckii TaxID=91943 RepID=A0A3M7D8Q1_HORWE|nr:hypothetical protein KC331_g1029 [Hortaea werneckii]KAI7721546.1 hypothetical protein KC353_g1272 [Hortaea werneckii]RMY60681.1 hypothetical protein D0865_01394 [Hortaea werneckii]